MACDVLTHGRSRSSWRAGQAPAGLPGTVAWSHSSCSRTYFKEKTAISICACVTADWPCYPFKADAGPSGVQAGGPGLGETCLRRFQRVKGSDRGTRGTQWARVTTCAVWCVSQTRVNFPSAGTGRSGHPSPWGHGARRGGGRERALMRLGSGDALVWLWSPGRAPLPPRGRPFSSVSVLKLHPGGKRGAIPAAQVAL